MAVAALARPSPAVKGPAPAGPMARGKAGLPFGGVLQAKMVLGPAQDRHEREADRAAAHVVGGRPGLPGLSALPPILGGTAAQRACSACGSDDETSRRRVQRKCACGASEGETCSCDKKKEEEHPELQIDRRAKAAPQAGADPLQAVDQVVRGAGRPLPDPVRQDMETAFGRNFSHVRIHDSPRAAASAEGIGAHAYTVGHHIAFNRGQYQPGTESGRFLLAHELAHTVQQAGAPPVTGGAARISAPGDRHEAQADRAATAALTGAAVPGLSPGAAPISRYSTGELGDDLLSAGEAVLDAGEAVVDAGAELVDTAGDALSALYDRAAAIAAAVGGAFSLDGTTLVISVPQFNPCSELSFDMQLSDLGLAPSLYFPVVAGGLGIGIVDVVGVLGIEVALDPGFGFNLAGCSFGPGEIRIDPLSGSTSVSGALSVTGASMVSLGGDIGVAGDLYAVIAWPDPPFLITVPLIGLSVGGTYQLMMQIGGTLSGAFSTSVGLGGVSSASLITGDVGVGMDLAYGLYGALRLLGFDLCRVGWPLDSKHWDAAASFTLATAASVNSGGLSFSFGLTAAPMATNPLDDLGFAFDASRLEDDCVICDFLTTMGLMPGQNGINWANPTYQAKLTRLGGPRPDVMARDPGLASGAKCRGACGIDCPENNCDPPADLVVCQNMGDRHEWHTYHDYSTCGVAQGCLNHDACYDAAAEMPIWGFGGVMFGPMYRVCDLEALCGYSFKQAVTWAGGGGPYDAGRMAYADERTVRQGCLGPCPQNVAAPGEAEVQQTCLTDRELWPGVEASDHWGREFFNQRLFTGFVRVPYIIGVNYGVDATARGDADARAQLGPINLQNACLIYDPVSQSYSGTADLSLFANLRGSARITASLEGFLSDFLCLLNWVTLRGTMSAGVTVQLPTNLTVGVDLYCQDGNLTVLPRAGLTTCLDIFGEISAGLDVFLLSYHVWGQEWPLIQKQIQKCWRMNLAFDPFTVGSMPNFRLESGMLAVESLLGELFEPARMQELDRTPARSPLPAAPGLLFPCLGDDPDDPDEPVEPDVNCPQRATGADGRRLKTAAERAPTWPATRTISIPGGGSATVGSEMVAPFLENTVTGGSPTDRTTQMQIYNHRGIPMRGCLRPSGGEEGRGQQQFVRGHLLNGDIGGPGTQERNLFPITLQANNDHKTRVEQGGENVVGRVRADQLIFYKVTVQNPSGPTEINDSAGNGTGFFEVSATFLCEIADYQLCSDETLRRNPSRFVPIPSRFAFHPSGGKAFDQIADPNRCRN